MENNKGTGFWAKNWIEVLLQLALIMPLALAGACSHDSGDSDTPNSKPADPTWAYMAQPRPGLTPQIFAEGFVSLEEGIYGTVVFSPDLTEAVWGPEGVPWLLMSRYDGEEWTEPVRLQFLENHGLTSPSYSPDGNRLYFLAGPSGSQGEQDDVWVVDREGEGWGEANRLDPAISDVSTHWQFSLDAEGNLYLMLRGADLYRAEYRNGHFANPQRIEGPINTSAPETGPFINPDGSFLLFDRWFDSPPYVRIMVSFREPSGEWGEPIDMSEALGNEGNDSSARISPDGRYLFFQSVRAGSSPSRSIYWVDASVIDSMRPRGDES